MIAIRTQPVASHDKGMNPKVWNKALEQCLDFHGRDVKHQYGETGIDQF
jgi:hypothetical protein